MRGAGGTEGGVVRFLAGLAMTVGGACFLTPPDAAASAFWGPFGSHPLGFTLPPLVVGGALLFFDGKSRLGQVLTLGGVLFVLLGVLMNRRTLLEPTSLVDTLAMLGLFACGLILLAGSLQPRRGRPPSREGSDDGPFA